MNAFRKVLGIFMLVVGVITFTLFMAGVFYSGQVIDNIGTTLDQTLDIVVQSLDAAEETLVVAKQTIVDATTAVGTVEETLQTTSQTFADTGPLLNNIGEITTQTAPDSIEAIQAAVPNIVEVASIIDSTMTTLSNFGFSREIAIPFSDPIDLGFDLGIDYAPEEPFDQTISKLDDSLDGLPEQLRTLGSDLDTANANLQTLSENLGTLSGDVGAIQGDIAALEPVLDEYLRIIGDVKALIIDLQARIGDQLDTAKLYAAIVLLAIALTQLAPIVLGLDMVTGWFDVDKDEMRKYVDDRFAALESGSAETTATLSDAVDSTKEALDEAS